MYYVLPRLFGSAGQTCCTEITVSTCWQPGSACQQMWPSIFAIVAEAVGHIMLLIPAAVRQLIAEGQPFADAEWEAWLKQRDEAQTNGQPFDEPPPSQRRNGRD